MKRKKRFRDIRPQDKKQLLKVAALYVTSHSDYFLDRALACLHKPKPLSSIVNCFVRKLDDKFWFVYSQVCNQTYWLTFQSLGISDKSRKDFESLMPGGTEESKKECVKSAFETASFPYGRIEFRKTPYVRIPKLSDRIKDPLVLAFFEDMSEPELDMDW